MQASSLVTGELHVHAQQLMGRHVCGVSQVGMPFRVKLAVLMAIVVQTSPSPPPSPSSRTFSQHSALTPFPGRPMAGRHM